MTRAQSLGSEEEGPEVRKQTQRGIGKKARLANPGSRVTARVLEVERSMWNVGQGPSHGCAQNESTLPSTRE